MGIDIFMQVSTARVRTALDTPGTKQEFLELQCSQFKDAVSKKQAFEKIYAVLQADGIDLKESKLLLQIRSILEI